MTRHVWLLVLPFIGCVGKESEPPPAVRSTTELGSTSELNCDIRFVENAATDPNQNAVTAEIDVSDTNGMSSHVSVDQTLNPMAMAIVDQCASVAPASDNDPSHVTLHFTSTAATPDNAERQSASALVRAFFAAGPAPSGSAGIGSSVEQTIGTELGLTLAWYTCWSDADCGLIYYRCIWETVVLGTGPFGKSVCQAARNNFGLGCRCYFGICRWAGLPPGITWAPTTSDVGPCVVQGSVCANTGGTTAPWCGRK
jgi:hypothetical protein